MVADIALSPRHSLLVGRCGTQRISSKPIQTTVLLVMYGCWHSLQSYLQTLGWQVWNAEDAKDDVLAMVVRTGINSTLGTLVKQFISPTQRPGHDPFINVSFACTHHAELSAAVTRAQTGGCVVFKRMS